MITLKVFLYYVRIAYVSIFLCGANKTFQEKPTPGRFNLNLFNFAPPGGMFTFTLRFSFSRS
jgi:hypothetical protein